jgi:hypothetical protein
MFSICVNKENSVKNPQKTVSCNSEFLALVRDEQRSRFWQLRFGQTTTVVTEITYRAARTHETMEVF